MNQRIQRRHFTDVLFVLILFLMFTASALAVIILGARVYQTTSLRMQNNYTERTALAYVSEKIRHFDQGNAVSLGELNGIPALHLSQDIEGAPYVTYIYFHDNALKELLVKADQEVSLEQGSRIVELADFSMEETQDGFYQLLAVDESGEKLSLYIRPKSM